MTPRIDPWAPPEKVHDAEAERLLGEVLAAIRDLNGRQVELESALETMAQRLADTLPKPEPIDLSPVVAAIERMGRAPVEVRMPESSPESRAMIDELREVVAEVGMKPTQWDSLVERLTNAVQPHGTMLMGGGGGRLRNTDNAQINPATEDTLSTVYTAVQAVETAVASVETTIENTSVTERIAADQTGADAVLTFELGGAVAAISVDVDNTSSADTTVYVCRVRADGTDPTATTGWRCRSGHSTFLPVSSSTGTIKVYAPTGVDVSVQGIDRDDGALASGTYGAGVYGAGLYGQ